MFESLHNPRKGLAITNHFADAGKMVSPEGEMAKYLEELSYEQ